MNKKLKISIIIPTYNKSRYIKKTIKSLLEQIELPEEIIIIDDCSTDDSYQIIKKLHKIKKIKIRIFKNKKNIGVSKTIAKGVNLSNNPIVGVVDPDSILPKNWIKKIKKTYQKSDDKTACVGSRYTPIKTNNLLTKLVYTQLQYQRKLASFIKPSGAAITFRKDIVNKLSIINNLPYVGWDSYLPAKLKENSYKIEVISSDVRSETPSSLPKWLKQRYTWAQAESWMKINKKSVILLMLIIILFLLLLIIPFCGWEPFLIFLVLLISALFLTSLYIKIRVPKLRFILIFGALILEALNQLIKIYYRIKIFLKKTK